METNDNILENYIGRKYDSYYREKWIKWDGKHFFCCWNWAGALLGVFWLFYRGLYKWGFILFIIKVLFDFIGNYFLLYILQIDSVIFYLINILVIILFIILLGKISNYLLFRHINKNIEKIKKENKPMVKSKKERMIKLIICLIIINIMNFSYKIFIEPNIYYMNDQTELMELLNSVSKDTFYKNLDNIGFASDDYGTYRTIYKNIEMTISISEGDNGFVALFGINSNNEFTVSELNKIQKMGKIKYNHNNHITIILKNGEMSILTGSVISEDYINILRVFRNTK
jgi:hypothetical protein